MLEGYTTLGYLAGQTEKLRLGLLVTGTTYRWPGLLAKIVTTSTCSPGAGDAGPVPPGTTASTPGSACRSPSTSERFERLEETLQIVRQMWSDDDGPYEGRHYRLAETVCVPPPVQQPRPPILVGGSGERKTLRMVAQYADACNLPAGPSRRCVTSSTSRDATRRGRPRPRRDREDHAQRRDRPRPGDRPRRLVRDMEPHAALGISLVTLMPPTDGPGRLDDPGLRPGGAAPGRSVTGGQAGTH